MKGQFAIEGMHCANCAMNIDEELEDMPGMREATTSYLKQRTDVEFDDTRVDIASIEKTITRLGYKAARL